jgi:hypothetical protein
MPRLRPLPRERQRRIWENLDATVFNHGGWTVSMPYAFPLRFECTDAVLPELLRAAEYEVASGGTAERFLPTSEAVRQAGGVTRVSVQHLKPALVQVWEVRLY